MLSIVQYNNIPLSYTYAHVRSADIRNSYFASNYSPPPPRYNECNGSGAQNETGVES